MIFSMAINNYKYIYARSEFENIHIFQDKTLASTNITLQIKFFTRDQRG